jgi:hypothetical protein
MGGDSGPLELSGPEPPVTRVASASVAATADYGTGRINGVEGDRQGVGRRGPGDEAKLRRS